MKKFTPICLLIPIILIISCTIFASGLEDKIIILNPGHGGHERGAVGSTGLEEQEINLKVGMYLKEMLEKEGARVYITRTGDYDLDGTENYSGSRDRFNRLRWGREKDADVFIALHHNSCINPEAQQIEVYYMSNYYGPSKELAEYVTAGLTEKMGINGIATTFSQLVVNHATIPTIIGEAGYISNPELEKKYREDSFLKKEAEGYYEGLKNFFANGMPKVKSIYPGINEKLSQSKPIIMAKVISDEIYSINPESVQAFLDKEMVNLDYNCSSGLVTIKCTERLTNGSHHLLVTAANKQGFRAVPLDYYFYIDEPPAQIVLSSYATCVPDNKDTIVKIKGMVLDKDGEPIMDGNLVKFELAKGGYFAQKEVFTRNGCFVNCLHRGEETYSIAPIRISIGNILEEIVVQWKNNDGYLYGQLTDYISNELLTETKVKLEGKKDYVTYSDYNGDYFFTDIKPGTYQLKVEKPGYETSLDNLDVVEKGVINKDLKVEPIAGGVLKGKKIIFNTVVEGKVAHLSFIRELKTELERAGAEVLVITDGINDKEVIKKTNKQLGQLMLSFKVNSDEKTILHYPKSEKYSILASELASQLGKQFTTEGCKSKLITFSNAVSFIITSSGNLEADNIYNWIVDYFSNLKE